MSYVSPLPESTLTAFQTELKKLEAREKALKDELLRVQLGIKVLNKALKGVVENDQ